MRDPKAVRYDPLSTFWGEKKEERSWEIATLRITTQSEQAQLEGGEGGRGLSCLRMSESPVGSLEPTDERDKKRNPMSAKDETHVRRRSFCFFSKIAKCYRSFLLPSVAGVRPRT